MSILSMFYPYKYLTRGKRCIHNNINEFLCKLTIGRLPLRSPKQMRI